MNMSNIKMFVFKNYFDCLNNFDLNESNFELTHFFYKKKLSDNEINLNIFR